MRDFIVVLSISMTILMILLHTQAILILVKKIDSMEKQIMLLTEGYKESK